MNILVEWQDKIDIAADALAALLDDLAPAVARESRWRLGLPMEGPLPGRLRWHVDRMTRREVSRVIEMQPEYRLLLWLETWSPCVFAVNEGLASEDVPSWLGETPAEALARQHREARRDCALPQERPMEILRIATPGRAVDVQVDAAMPGETSDETLARQYRDVITRLRFANHGFSTEDAAALADALGVS